MDELPLEISCREVVALREQTSELVLLDCREVEEHTVAAIAGATLVPMSEIQARLDELTPHKTRRVVVHCHLGMRSAQVAAWLREQGFDQVQSMAGGIDAWAEEVDPTVPRY